MTRQVALVLWLVSSRVLADTGAVPVGTVEPYAAGILDYAATAGPRRETVAVPGAAFLRIHFRGFHLAPGDAVAMSAPDGRDRTRYSGRGPSGTGEFWSFTITGDTAVLDLETTGAALPGFGYGYEVDAVVRGDQGWMRASSDDMLSIESVCGDDGMEDVACHAGEVGLVPGAVARLNYVSGGSSFVCTGWLVRGAQASTLMTNNHCIATQADADTVEARFNFQMDSCGGTALAPDKRHAGGTLLRTSADLDYSLLTLQGDPELVWGELTASNRAVSAGELIWVIQHPVGQPKKIGYWEDAAKTERCDVEMVDMTVAGYTPGTQIGYSCDSRAGSSGAPLILSGSREVIGLHHLGGCFNAATHMTAICADAGSLLDCAAGPATPSPTATPTSTPTPTPTSTPTPTPTPTPNPSPTYVEVTPTAVTATGHDGNVPANTVDNQLGTRWSAWGIGHRLRLDLGAVRRVAHVNVAVYRGDTRRNRFYLQVSVDACTWTTVFYGYSSGATASEETYDFPDVPARYVRYIGLGASFHAGGTTLWNSLSEISVFAAP